eukprot:Seg1701.10 transcript_id=Seg1701.10/GoldUCD/mRNA.D3Y31 product="Spermidine synthase" protein_id=Seg1701.10/GoldUCD/D3Y31
MSEIVDGVFYEEVFDGIPFETITGLRIERILYQGSSKYQDIIVFDSIGFGRVLVLDGFLQLSTHDEFAYHETLAFTALSCHQSPQKVLIVGGGDGGMAREIIKFPTVQSITVCEIDKEVVNICEQHFQGLSKSFDHPKVDLVIEDAFKFLQDKQKEYDVIICDSTDPERDDSASCLFSDEFYDMVKKALKPNGIFLSQTGNNFWQPKLKKLQKTCTTRYPVVSFGFVSVPCFCNSQNGFVICALDEATNVQEPHWKLGDDDVDRLGLKFYNLDIHRSSFALPNYLKKYLLKNDSEQLDIVKWMKSVYEKNSTKQKSKIHQNGI